MKLTEFRPTAQRGPRVEGSTALSDAQALDVFDSETEPPRPADPEPVRPKAGVKLRVDAATILSIGIAAGIGIIVGAAGLWTYQRFMLGRTPGSLRVETSVPGVDVLLSGKNVGRTPLSLALAPGSYQLQLAGAGAQRDFAVDLAPGATVVRHVEMPPPAPAASAVGSLHVQTEPGRLPISVDGVERGTSPLTIAELTPGEHQVAVRADGAIVRRTVTIQANERTVLVVSPVDRASTPAPINAAAGGWLALTSPIALVIREGGKVIGSTDAERLMLPAGEHTLELSNESLGFQAKRTVRIEPGKSNALKVDLPNGALSINAQPWAEVWVDGQRVGETPIGNLPRVIGQHEVVLRHPDLGERRETVTITLRQPARLGVDMRKK